VSKSRRRYRDRERFKVVLKWCLGLGGMHAADLP
jgi:hypothetical protein